MNKNLLKKIPSIFISLVLTLSHPGVDAGNNLFAEEVTMDPTGVFVPTVPAESSQISEESTSEQPENFMLQNETLSAPENVSVPEQITPEYLQEVSLSYFDPSFGTVEPTSGYPFEGFNQRGYTQPTGIAFYAQLLANIATGDVVTAHISKEQALVNLDQLMNSLLRDQTALGYKGLMPWLVFDGTTWKRGNGTFDTQVSLGENANLSAALGAASGALLDPLLTGNTVAAGIRSKIESFLNKQKTGFTFLYDVNAGKFRQGYDFVKKTWVGGAAAYHEYLGDEFRSGILFITLRYAFADAAYQNLKTLVKEYTLQNGEVLNTIAPFDGGAFQMLWPAIFFNEEDNPALNTSLRNFVRIALDFSEKNNLPGFLSASYTTVGQYGSNIGITDIAANNQNRDEWTASLYTLGAAHMFFPEEIEALLQDIFLQYPDLISAHGLWEGIDGAHQVIQEQVVANVASFVLGLAGTGPDHMRAYLNSKSLLARLDTFYHSQATLDLIGKSLDAFSWSDQPIVAYREGSEYVITSSQYENIGTALIEDNLDLTNKKLRITYRSTTDVGVVRLELKERRYLGEVVLRHAIEDLHLENTNGAERTIFVELPHELALFSIDEIVFLMSGGNGTALDLRFTEVEAVPANAQSIVRDAANIFAWGQEVTGQVQGVNGYAISSPHFYSSGTAFIQNGIDISGGELRIQYTSNRAVSKVTLELKEQTVNGLQTMLVLKNLTFASTSGKVKELVVQLPDANSLSHIDEMVLLLDGGTGLALNLILNDVTVVLKGSADIIPSSASIVSWGNAVNAFSEGEGYRVTTPQFFDTGTAFIQSDEGAFNLSGKQLQIRYQSNAAVDQVSIEFKKRDGSNLTTAYVVDGLALENTGGVEKDLLIQLPELLELSEIHELVVILSGGSGSLLDVKFTRIYAAERDIRDLLKESTSKVTSGNKLVQGNVVGDSYVISTNQFYSSTTTIKHNRLNYSGRVIRIRYSSTQNISTVSLQFAENVSGTTYTTRQTISNLRFSDTEGEVQELLVYLPVTTNLSKIDQIKLITSGGTGLPLNLTIFDFEVI